MKLIDKDKVVVEIERRIYKYEKEYEELVRYEIWITAKEIEPKIKELKNLLSFINIFEEKEVDLDGISRHYALNNTPWDDCVDEIQDAYKAGFELGLKTQKGE